MKYLDEYRDPQMVRRLAEQIAHLVRRPWNIMEVCGGQTHAIMRFSLDALLPTEITLIHGPGCPVCVTPVETVDRAIWLASQSGVILCSFGDMLRVPGSQKDLFTAKSEGGDVRVVYSPLDAVRLAQRYPDQEVVFFAIGFETTAPANAAAVRLAKQWGLKNFSLLAAHVLVPPAMEAVLQAPGCQVHGFLAAGHVCTVTGMEPYRTIADRYRTPIVVTGFEPVDILRGILCCVRQLEEGRHEVENAYGRSVRPEGNLLAQRQIEEVFQRCDRKWRGIGVIQGSGLELRPEYAQFDAVRRFGLEQLSAEEPAECIAGQVLQGIKKPVECPLFGTACTPEHPRGAPMVSAEGACAAYYRYRPVASSPNKHR
ncbi:MAG TPA: hydrogenase formation protein HypD [Thermoguttaceae bacterium]|nr:hydrogenase formation protein HypD [Thermoguttaceae bacterium]